MLVGLAKRHAECLGMAITPDRELRRTPSRNFANHPPKLLGAFYALTVDFGYDIIFLQSSLGGRTVRNDLAQKGASLGGKLELFDFFGIYLGDANAEPATAGAEDNLHVVLISNRSKSRIKRNADPALALIFISAIEHLGLLRFTLGEYFDFRLGSLALRTARSRRLAIPPRRRSWKCNQSAAERTSTDNR